MIVGNLFDTESVMNRTGTMFDDRFGSHGSEDVAELGCIVMCANRDDIRPIFVHQLSAEVDILWVIIDDSSHLILEVNHYINGVVLASVLRVPLNHIAGDIISYNRGRSECLDT